MQFGFFDIDDKYEKLTELGDPLVQIDQLIDFSLFEDIFFKAFPKNDKPSKKNPKNAGRKPIGPSIIIKTIFLKRLFSLSNEQAEFQITDRHSFQRFIGLDANKSAPDFTTIWRYENKLSQFGYIDLMFERFDQFLNKQGFIANEGAIIDATIVEVPRQWNTRDENKQIKSGTIPKSIQKNAHKRAQKDLDARWTKKRNINYYGYKNHVLIDDRFKLIRSFDVTSANVHDSTPANGLLAGSIAYELFGDSAYQSPEISGLLKHLCINNFISEKGYRNKKLTQSQIESNHHKSKTRCRVEHVFGFMQNTMKAKFIRTIGIKRARFQIGLTNLVYNICRYVQLQRIHSY
jgi:transposase, IS5 family